MSAFPIILFPPAIALIQTQLPPLPELTKPQPPSEPKPPNPVGTAPRRVEWGAVGGITLGVALFCLICGGVGAMLASSLAILAGGLAAFAIPGAIVWGVTSQIRSFPKRYRAHEQDTHRFAQAQRQYEKARLSFPERKRQYRDVLEAYQQKQERIKADCHTLEKVAEFRQHQYLQVLRQTSTYDSKGKSKAGASEGLFKKKLNSYFPGKVYTELRLAIPGTDYFYYPDFSYIDKLTGLHINIEIDEPYAYSSRNPIHYVGEDDRRNNFFLRKGWVVVRLSKKQVVVSPNRCCKAIAQVVADLTGTSSIMKSFENIPDLDPMPQWSYNESLEMAKSQYRDTYSQPKLPLTNGS